LALHHPPFSGDSDWLDQSALQQPERLFQVLDEFDHIRLVIFGHIHQDLHRRRHGVDYFACPSTCVQFRPKSSRFSLDVIPPALRQIWLEQDGSFKTQGQRGGSRPANAQPSSERVLKDPPLSRRQPSPLERLWAL